MLWLMQFSETQDPQLESALVVSQGKLNQAQLEDYQSDALDLYKAKEPKVISFPSVLMTIQALLSSQQTPFKRTL